MANSAFVELAHVEVTSNVTAVDLPNCMSDTYMNYYVVASNVTLNGDGGFTITGKVSNTAKSANECNYAGRVSDMGSVMQRAITSTYSGPLPHIMIQRNYNFQSGLTGNRAILEGYLFNVRSSSHNKYAIFNSMHGTSNTSDRFWRYRMQSEDDSTNVYDGLYCATLGASHFTGGKFTVFGIRQS